MSINELRALVATMPHNGTRMFSSNKNELGHDQCCYKCKLEAALKEQGDNHEAVNRAVVGED